MNALIIKDNNEIQSKFNMNENILNDFLAFLDAKPRTAETYYKNLKSFWNYVADNQIKEPTRIDIVNYRHSLQSKGLANTTIQSYMTAVKLFFRWTATTGLYPNIADNVKGAKVARTNKKDHLTSTQAKEIINKIDKDTVKGLRDYAILVLMITTGLRTIEVVRAKIEDIRTIGDNTVLFIQGKGKEDKSDYVKLPLQTEKALREWLKKAPISKEDAPLFQSISNNNKGGRMTTRAISGICKNSMIEAGFDSNRLTAHSLRHTAVTLSLMAGNSIQEAQQFARHANITTTQIYAHNLEKLNNKCSESVANSLF